jgi:hypothetical protein
MSRVLGFLQTRKSIASKSQERFVLLNFLCLEVRQTQSPVLLPFPITHQNADQFRRKSVYGSSATEQFVEKGGETDGVPKS